jgi:Ca2+-binding EF-hand superfamily protein
MFYFVFVVFAAAFAMYDVDGDGKISHKDLLDILTLTVKFQGVEGKEAIKVLMYCMIG